MNNVVPSMDEIDIVDTFYNSVHENVCKTDENISVPLPREEDEAYNQAKQGNDGETQDKGGVSDAVMRYYYNFRPYVVGSAPDAPIFVGNKRAGTLLQPNVDLLLKHAKPAPFGKGGETVFDENVRRAKSIPAKKLTFQHGSLGALPYEIRALAQQLHNEHYITLKLSKLHIYEEGGHFDPHRDTLCSENHVGSIVVLLGTPFTGGEFFINGEHCPLEIDRAAKKKDQRIPFVAFYTDIVHEVRPVTSGVRVSLQFDVFANQVKRCYGCVQEYFFNDTFPTTPTVDEERCGVVVAEISTRLTSTPNLIIPTYHRYPQPALHRNTLKPIDEMLARKLVEQGYSVTPVPLTVVEEKCGREIYTGASLFWQLPFNQGKPTRAPEGTEFVALPQMEGLKMYAQAEIEYTGNEAQCGLYAYYLSGLLISLRAAEEQISSPTTSARADEDVSDEKVNESEGEKEAIVEEHEDEEDDDDDDDDEDDHDYGYGWYRRSVRPSTSKLILGASRK